VTFAEAALGADIAVPTLDAPVTIRLRPGTASGTTLRVAGRGLPAGPGGASGDLLVTVEVEVPERLSDAQRAAVEQLAAATTGSPRRHLGCERTSNRRADDQQEGVVAMALISQRPSGRSAPTAPAQPRRDASDEQASAGSRWRVPWRVEGERPVREDTGWAASWQRPGGSRFWAVLALLFVVNWIVSGLLMAPPQRLEVPYTLFREQTRSPAAA
jgi:hypothetical protein